MGNNNRYHNINNPAIIWYSISGEIRSEEWYYNGRVHNSHGGPAKILYYYPEEGGGRKEEYYSFIGKYKEIIYKENISDENIFDEKGNVKSKITFKNGKRLL